MSTPQRHGQKSRGSGWEQRSSREIESLPKSGRHSTQNPKLPRYTPDAESAYVNPIFERERDSDSSYVPTEYSGSRTIRPSEVPASQFNRQNTGVQADNTSTRLPGGTGYTSLSRIGQIFAAIKMDEYRKCYQFLSTYDREVDFTRSQLSEEAVEALISADRPHARRCVQQALLLDKWTKIQTPHQRKAFFEALESGRTGHVKDFMESFDQLWTTVNELARSRGSEKRTSSSRYSTEPVGRHQQTQQRAVREQGGDEQTPLSYIEVAREWSVDRHQGTREISAPRLGSGLDPLMGRLKLADPSQIQSPQNQSRHATVQSGPTKTSLGRHHQSLNAEETRPLVIMDEESMSGSIFRSDSLSPKDLDARYRVQKSAFFRVGRLLALLWRENVGLGKAGSGYGQGQQVYSHIRRMVVVKEGSGFSLACPINTYGGQGLKKRSLSQEDIDAHAIIYMKTVGPKTLNDEPSLSKRPIAVFPVHDQELHPSSRVYFAKIHTIEHNTRVMNVGMVTPDSIPYLEHYFRNQIIGADPDRRLLPDDAESGLELKDDRVPG